MSLTVILSVLGAWVLLSAPVAMFCAAVVRGGRHEDDHRAVHTVIPPPRPPSSR